MQSLFKFISRLQRKKEQFLLLSQSERDEIKKTDQYCLFVT